MIDSVGTPQDHLTATETYFPPHLVHIGAAQWTPLGPCTPLCSSQHAGPATVAPSWCVDPKILDNPTREAMKRWSRCTPYTTLNVHRALVPTNHLLYIYPLTGPPRQIVP